MKSRPVVVAALALPALAAVACGGSNPPPAPPSAAPAPTMAREAPPDISPVPAPEKLLVFARVNKPAQVVNVVGGWVGMPLPAADAVSEILTGESVGAAIDLDQPVDVAVAGDPRGRSPKPIWAMSAAVKSPAAANELLGKSFAMTKGANGVVRLEEKGKPRGEGDDDGDADERHCSLYPAFQPGGATGARLVCADSVAAVDALGSWLARTSPRNSYPSDVHVDVNLQPMRPIVMQGRTLLPTMATNMLGVRRGDNAAVAELVTAMIGDLVDFALDLDHMSLDAKVDDPAAAATLTTSFQDTSSLLARLATSHPERADAPPAALWRLPADTDAAFFYRGVDAKDLDHPRDLVLDVVGKALDKQQVPAADKKALTDAVTHYVALFSSPGVFARGVDWATVQKTMAAQKASGAAVSGAAPGKAAKANADDATARGAAWTALAGWAMSEIDEPIAKTGAVAKELAAALGKPGIVKYLKSEAGAAPPLTVRVTPVPAKAGALPKDTVHLEITSVHVIHDRPSKEPVPAAKPGAAPKPEKAEKPELGKPVTMHLFVVPDAGHSWIAFGLDEALLGSKLRAAVPTTTAPAGGAAASADTGTLAKREGLDDLRNAKASSGGFFDARGLLAGTPLGYLTDAMPSTTFRDPFRNLASTPSQGGTPIPFTMLAQAPASGTKGGTLVVTTKVPRAAIVDMVAVAMRHR